MNTTKYSDSMLSSLKCTELKQLCKENNLPIRKRRKDELITTLKSVPAFSDEEEDEDDEDLPLNELKRPVFEDISMITVNSPSCSSVRERKRRCVEGEDISVGEKTVYFMRARTVSEKKSDTCNLTDQDVLKKSAEINKQEEELQTLIKQLKERSKLIVNVIEKNAELEKSKRIGENYLKEILERKILEKDKEKEKLLVEKESLSKKMKTEQKELRFTVKQVKTKLEEKENELLTQTALMKSLETNVRAKIIEGIEDEFTCMICQELFICAVTLPCTHSFCEACLMNWFKTRKSCPVCRRDVKQRAFFSVVLDSAVEKISECLDADSKHRRTILLRERNEVNRRNDGAEDPQGIRKMIYRIDEENDTPPHVPGPSRQAAVGNRRRSRSQSPARALANNNSRGNSSNQGNVQQNVLHNNHQHNNFSGNRTSNRTHVSHCWNCGGNHYARDCLRIRRMR